MAFQFRYMYLHIFHEIQLEPFFFPHFFGPVIVQKLNGHHFCPTAVPQHSINYFLSATDSFKSSKRDVFLTISQGSLMKK